MLLSSSIQYIAYIEWTDLLTLKLILLIIIIRKEEEKEEEEEGKISK